MNCSLIFLTGCVNPGGMGFTRLQDPAVRKQQYLDTIKFYLKKTNLPILFIENSGYDLSNEFAKEIQDGRMEVLTFNGNNYDKSMGKGHGEMLIIEHAINNSKFFNYFDYVIKITGRYQILNLKVYLDRFEKEPYDLNIDLKFNLTESDSRFWISKRSFFGDYLVKHKNQINDLNGVYFEHALCKAALQAIVDGYTYTTLKTWRRYYAISGTKNETEYESVLKWHLKNIRHLIRYFLLTKT